MENQFFVTISSCYKHFWACVDSNLFTRGNCVGRIFYCVEKVSKTFLKKFYSDYVKQRQYQLWEFAWADCIFLGWIPPKMTLSSQNLLFLPPSFENSLLPKLMTSFVSNPGYQYVQMLIHKRNQSHFKFRSGLLGLHNRILQ